MRVLVPGAHIFIATNPLLSHHVYVPLMEAGFEKRGEIVRIVKTLRGGDRPKGAHQEVSGCIRDAAIRLGTLGPVPQTVGGPGAGQPPKMGAREDCAVSPTSNRSGMSSSVRPASKAEREVAPHPSLKPQRLMRQLTRAALPLGAGTILDPFMGSGSTVAAARAVGLHAVGIEASDEYHAMARRAVPLLAALKDD